MSSHRPLRIGLLGEFGIGNFGNDGSLEAMLRELRARHPSAELLCICKNPAAIERRFAVRSIALDAPGPPRWIPQILNRALLAMPARLHNLSHALRHARSLDALIVPGTGALDDFGQTPGALPYDLWRWCVAARLCGAKVAFVSVGAGPIRVPLSRALMKGAAACAHYRSYRDDFSKTFMAGIGLQRPDDPIFPDLAFGLPAPPRLARINDAPATVAVGLMKYFGWAAGATREAGSYDGYLDRIVDYVVWLLGCGYRVEIVIGDEIDRVTAAEVCERVRAQVTGDAARSLIAGNSDDLHGVMRQFARADIVVATRFHNLVCALLVGTPAISLGYAQKNRALLAEFGLGEFCQEVENFDLDLLKKQTQRLLAAREDHEAAVARQLVEIRARLDRQQQLIDELILTHRSAG